MKLIIELLNKSKNLFRALKNYTKKGCLTETVKINMAEREINDSTDVPPNKKPCIDVKNGEAELKEQKIRNRKVALLIAYLGDNYCGLQVNTSVKTIEGELLSALRKANVIRPEGVTEPQTIKFQRTARTDKGVSAAKQVISLKIAENYNIECINKYLPEDIKLLSGKKVTKRFNCKIDCTARTYSYTLPTFALVPELHTEYPEKYRINEQALNKANEILISYKGTHNFYNFTTKKDYCDPSVRRYIINISLEKPFLYNDEEFITIKIKGQSFLFHQIRKMVGHTIAVLKGVVPETIQADVWNNTKYSVPLAPGLGLVLEDVHFERYNKRFGSDGIHESLDWAELNDEISKFRSFILSNILKKEVERKSMFNWLSYLTEHSYDATQPLHHFENLDETNEEEIPDEKIQAVKCTE